MRVREVARYLDVSGSLVYQLIAEGKLKCTRHGLRRGVIRVSEAQVADYLAAAEQTQDSRPPREQLRHLKL